MESFLRKYGWALNGVLIAIAALLAALVVSSLLSTELAPYTVPALGELEAEKKKKTTRRPKLPKRVDKAKDLAKRCLMECAPDEEAGGDDEGGSCPEEGCPEGQTCQEGACVAADDVGPALGAAGTEGLIVASDLNVTLQGVMVAKPNRWSTALIQDPTTKQTYVVSPGDQVLSVAELVEVRRDRIIIERNGRKEFIKLFGAISGDPGGKRAAAPSTRPAKVKPTAGAVTKKEKKEVKAAEGVTELKKGQYRVDRESINAALKDKRSLSKGATVVPNYSNGKKNGLKLIGVKNDSVYGTLGMQSGDVLKSVNGKRIKSQAHAAELFDQFREADEVRVEIERSGKKQKLKYKIK